MRSVNIQGAGTGGDERLERSWSLLQKLPHKSHIIIRMADIKGDMFANEAQAAENIRPNELDYACKKESTIGHRDAFYLIFDGDLTIGRRATDVLFVKLTVTEDIMSQWL